MGRFRFIRQHDTMQCGVASLCMVCNALGLRCSVGWLEEKCRPTNQGVSFKSISDAASELGLETCSVRISLDRLGECPLPAILHWNQNHFVVLYRVDSKGRRYRIADPGKGKYKVSGEEMKQHWVSSQSDNEGIAMLFRRDNSLRKSKVEYQPTHKSFGFLLGYVMRYRQYFMQILTGLLIGCVLQLIMPFLTQWIVDVGIKYKDIKLIWLILLGELMIVFGRTATDFIRRWLLLHISMRINISLVSNFFIKLLKLPMSFFDTKLIGDLMQRISDHGRVQSFLTGQVLGAMFTFLSFAIFGIVLFIFDKIVFCIFLTGSLLYGGWTALFLSRRKVLDYELFEQQAINQNKTFELITSIQEIKLQNCERRRRWEWEDTQADLFSVQMKSMKLQQTLEAGSVFINEIKNIFITVFAATAVIDGHLTLGGMLAIQYIVGQLNSPVEQFMQLIYSIQDVRISLERINEIHNAKDEQSNEMNCREFTSDKTVKVKGVNFKYDLHALKNTLEDISFTLPEGKVTAIVGASGSGKSTLIKLMLGYYPVSEGEIRISGVDIKKYDLKWWRNHCGVVMQDGVIFSESIARNIAVDDGEIDEDRIKEAAKVACIQDYVMSLPLGYGTNIGRGGIALSQGQKQRILIARAVYKSPDFIFLDEATNSLDASNERTIVGNLATFYKGRTVVVVAHRLSTVRNADQIIVLDSGRITEIGTHDSLIERKGAYYNLVKNQLELGN